MAGESNTQGSNDDQWSEMTHGAVDPADQGLKVDYAQTVEGAALLEFFRQQNENGGTE